MHKPADESPRLWDPIPEGQRDVTEAWARQMFAAWLLELDDGQLAALVANWENVVEDAALDRVDSWVIAGRAIEKLREPGGGAG